MGNLEKHGNLEKNWTFWKNGNWKFGKIKLEIWEKIGNLDRGPGICNLLSDKDDLCFHGDIFVSAIQFKFATKL